jgi:heat shock protein HtpX
MNRFKTFILLAAMTALIMGLGQMLGGRGGLMLALIFAAVMNLGSYWFSDKIVLAMYKAQPVTETEAPELYRIVADLTQRAALPMPKVYIIPEDAPNAFATGRNPEHAAVAVTEGILRILDRNELSGVLAHELGHVKNRDTLIMAVAATIAGAISHLANMAMWSAIFGGGRHSDDEEGSNPLVMLIGVIVAPFAAMLIQMAISRSREFLADEAGAQFSGNPLYLANALRKLESWKAEIPMTTGSPATAHLFIINPFSGGGMAKLFSTHPSTEERIARLEGMTMGGQAASRPS